MADEERRDDATRFDGYLEALLGEGRPSPESVADRDEAEMARRQEALTVLARQCADHGHAADALDRFPHDALVALAQFAYSPNYRKSQAGWSFTRIAGQGLGPWISGSRGTSCWTEIN